jgi:LysM repeat protein
MSEVTGSWGNTEAPAETVVAPVVTPVNTPTPSADPAIAAVLAEVNSLRQQVIQQQTDAAATAEAAKANDPRDSQIALLLRELDAVRARQGVPATQVPHVKYVVQPGDTLASIGKTFDSPVSILQAINSVTLEGHAQARGFQDSEGGRLLFPGTELKVPKPVEVTSATTPVAA